MTKSARRLLEALEAVLAAAAATSGSVAHLADDVREPFADRLVVVDDEDGRHLVAFGAKWLAPTVIAFFWRKMLMLPPAGRA